MKINEIKIVYNADYGGFTVPDEYVKLKGSSPKMSYYNDYTRTDPLLIEMVEHPNYKGSLKIRTLPKGTIYRINEYDGYEKIMTFDEHKWFIA